MVLGICLPHLEKVTPEMRAAVADLTKGCHDERAKIEALFAFVSQKIRYMGITTETEAPGYEPHDVNITFENRYGVCRDKAALLAALLRTAGIDGFPVIIHVGAKRDAEVPMPYFNHAIAAARLKDGTTLLMDPTDEATRELMPAYLGNRSYLVATPDGDPLRTSPYEPAGRQSCAVGDRGRSRCRWRAPGRTTARFDGVNDNAYRGYFARLKPDERTRFFESVAKRALPAPASRRWKSNRRTCRTETIHLSPVFLRGARPDRSRPAVALVTPPGSLARWESSIRCSIQPDLRSASIRSSRRTPAVYANPSPCGPVRPLATHCLSPHSSHWIRTP
jgi:hypothetical protein